jgi:ABC-type transporter Mla MlaB component
MLRERSVLRITMEEQPEEVTLKLEGQLIGAWVAELENSWRTTNSILCGRLLCLDLNAVNHVDGAGKYLLALIARNGAQLRASGAEMKELLRAIAREWPLQECWDIS